MLDALAQNAELINSCFAEDTAVHVEKSKIYGTNLEKIQFIEVGDKVLSRCESTGEMAYKRVTKVFYHGFKDVYMVSCKYGLETIEEWANYSGILVTEEHPFWVKRKGWTVVKNLRVGDELLAYDGIYAELSYKKMAPAQCVVFNIEVEDFNTYFVRWRGLWVHNEKGRVTVSGRPF